MILKKAAPIVMLLAFGSQARPLLAVCGDGHLDPGEECDDGNVVDFDTCSAVCEFTFDPDEVDGDTQDSCGDGRIDPGEECDDGDLEDFDECSNDCQDRIDPDESDGDDDDDDHDHDDDDDDRDDNDDTTDEDATGGFPATCGNGVLDENEECDDGDVQSGDGCSRFCRVEASVQQGSSFDQQGGCSLRIP